MDRLLHLAALYKRTDPRSDDEIELIENVFNTMCTALLHEVNKDLFVKGEGIELMLLTLKCPSFHNCFVW